MATDTALCDNLAQKNVILPQIHTQPVLQVSHAYTIEIPVSLLELEKTTFASVQCKGTLSALVEGDPASWTWSGSPPPSCLWQSRSTCLLHLRK